MRQLFVKYRLDFRLIEEMQHKPEITWDHKELRAAQLRVTQCDREAWRRFGCEVIDLYAKLDKEQRAIVHGELKLIGNKNR